MGRRAEHGKKVEDYRHFDIKLNTTTGEFWVPRLERRGPFGTIVKAKEAIDKVVVEDVNRPALFFDQHQDDGHVVEITVLRIDDAKYQSVVYVRKDTPDVTKTATRDDVYADTARNRVAIEVLISLRT